MLKYIHTDTYVAICIYIYIRHTYMHTCLKIDLVSHSALAAELGDCIYIYTHIDRLASTSIGIIKSIYVPLGIGEFILSQFGCDNWQ